MKTLLWLFLSAFALADLPADSHQFPIRPDPRLTPGDLCDRADEIRYPEHITYCSRGVSSAAKWSVIRTYDEQLGYKIESMHRGDFKIDHYIPLCMGGSNEADNLWPQHKSIYVYTDSIEEKLCRLMAHGTMKQAEAIETIRKVKNDLYCASNISEELDRRLR